MRTISTNLDATNGNSATILLRSWKEISAYMALGIRTVQRYEAKLGLPVHRVPGASCAVWAFSNEIDEWLRRPITIRRREGTANPLDENLRPADAAMASKTSSYAKRTQDSESSGRMRVQAA